MENFYAFITSNPQFNKIVLNKITIIQYDCPLQEAVVPIWTPHDYIVHVLNGRKTWYSAIGGSFTLQKGDTAYIKKGGHFVHQHFEDNFCLLIFFISDEIKKELSFTHLPHIQKEHAIPNQSNFFRIKGNLILETFFYSILSYFKMPQPPNDEVKKLKLKEFLHVLSTESENKPAIRELLNVEHDALSYLKIIMSQNYMYNFSLKEFAELCNRSISSFRRDFMKCYSSNLSTWLSSMRLNHASSLLIHTDLPVSQVALESGFENFSHFSRCFKEKLNASPSQYRQLFKLNISA